MKYKVIDLETLYNDPRYGLKGAGIKHNPETVRLSYFDKIMEETFDDVDANEEMEIVIKAHSSGQGAKGYLPAFIESIPAHVGEISLNLYHFHTYFGSTTANGNLIKSEKLQDELEKSIDKNPDGIKKVKNITLYYERKLLKTEDIVKECLELAFPDAEIRMSKLGVEARVNKKARVRLEEAEKYRNRYTQFPSVVSTPQQAPALYQPQRARRQQIQQPQLPQQVAPQPPQQIAPQLPQQIAPQLPQQVVPQLPQQVAPQLPQLPQQVAPPQPPPQVSFRSANNTQIDKFYSIRDHLQSIYDDFLIEWNSSSEISEKLAMFEALKIDELIESSRSEMAGFTEALNRLNTLFLEYTNLTEQYNEKYFHLHDIDAVDELSNDFYAFGNRMNVILYENIRTHNGSTRRSATNARLDVNEDRGAIQPLKKTAFEHGFWSSPPNHRLLNQTEKNNLLATSPTP